MAKVPELKVRDKVVVRMTQEGVVEENLTAGTEQRVSKRLEDAEDVYKRQSQSRTATGLLFLCTFSKIHTQSFSNQGGKSMAFINQAVTVLDVYKRQVLRFRYCESTWICPTRKGNY